MNELNPEDVMKALELCNIPRSGVCKICPYHEFGASCHTKRNADALALLREKDAEIERLRKAKCIYSTVDYCADDLANAQEEIERLENICQSYALQYGTARDKEYFLKKAKAEAITEFAERLKASLNDVARMQMHGVKDEYYLVGKPLVDKIAKEMKEAQ